jgi:phage-related protein
MRFYYHENIVIFFYIAFHELAICTCSDGYIPETYFKHMENTDGLFEIRIQQGSDIYRIFCFFDQGQLVVLANGFQKKTQKTPKQEIEKALKIKEEYFNEKK